MGTRWTCECGFGYVVDFKGDGLGARRNERTEKGDMTASMPRDEDDQ